MGVRVIHVLPAVVACLRMGTAMGWLWGWRLSRYMRQGASQEAGARSLVAGEGPRRTEHELSVRAGAYAHMSDAIEDVTRRDERDAMRWVRRVMGSPSVTGNSL